MNMMLYVLKILNMKVMSQSLSFGESVADNDWGMFVNFLAYKLEKQNKELSKIDGWYASSQTEDTRIRKLKNYQQESGYVQYVEHSMIEIQMQQSIRDILWMLNL